MDERPVKRARLDHSNDIELNLQPRGHGFGNIAAGGSAPIQLGDNLGVQNHYYYSHDQARKTSGNNSQEKYEALLKSLLFPRMDARVNNVSKALHDTCTWIFQHKLFKEWHSDQTVREHNGFLWIKGKPGCGKSTIMKTTLEWAQKQARRKSTDRKVVYYFFNARASTSLEKSTLGLYRFLVYQLLELHPSLRSHFTTKFALKNPEQSGNEWTRNELQDFLHDTVHLGQPCSLYILIDALDEGEEQRDVRDMINFLVDLSESALSPESSLNLRVCLSSRHYPYISIRKGLSLTVEEQAEHDRDIQTYVRQKLTGHNGMASSIAATKGELVAEVCRRSASIFLWVVLVIRLLHEVEDRGGTPAEMKALLDTIPGDLNELFEKILTRSDYGIEACIALLQWVLFAFRSLSPEELYLATEYSRSPADPTWAPKHEINVPSQDLLLLYILECSRGLVEITTAQPPTVQFIHETVRDYLLHSNGLATLLPALSDNLIGISHEVLKTSCVRYAHKCNIPDDLYRYVTEGYAKNLALEDVKDRLRSEMPFIQYSVSHLFGHADQAQVHGISQKEFLQERMTGPHWRLTERLWRNIFERFRTNKYDSHVTLQYFLAEQGLEHTLQEAMRIPFIGSNPINTRCGRYGTVLCAACVNGNENIVRALISGGATVNQLGGEHGHALLAAIYSKKYDLIDVLRANRAAPTPDHLNKALFEMIARRSTQGVTALLEIGADVNGIDRRGRAAIAVACETNRADIVDLLMSDPNFNIDLALLSHRGLSLLYTASCRGFTRVVRSLTENHKRFAQDILDLSLKEAFANGHFDVASLLIKNNAAFAKHDVYYYEKLWEASQTGYNKRIQLLIDGGVDLISAQKGNQSPLVAACEYGYPSTVQLLIDNGADVNITATGSRPYYTALQAACHNGHTDIAKLLLEKGAKVNSEGGLCGTALEAACRGGDLSTVELLINNGADVDATASRDYHSALQAACHIGHTDIAKLLLEKGAKVNSEGGLCGTALQAACLQGHLRTVQLLLDQGANVHVRFGLYGNALQAACVHGDSDQVSLLLAKGADVNITGGHCGSALQAACRFGHIFVARLLLAKGAKVNMQGGHDGSALHAAVHMSHPEVAQLLIQHGADVNARLGPNHTTALHNILDGKWIFQNNSNRDLMIQILRNAGAEEICETPKQEYIA